MPSSSHHRHEPLPSLPPSPSTEEDLSAMRSHQDDDVMDHQLLVPGRARRKGKGKAVEGADSDLELDEPFTPPSEVDSDNGRGVASYPPTTEEEEESRRVEENLRRWEQKERERRRAARESFAGSVSSSSASVSGTSRTSIVSGVARRTTQLFQSRHSSRHSSGGSNAHHVLGSRESIDTAVPLEDIPQEPERESESGLVQSPTTPTQTQTLVAPPRPRDNLSPSSPYDNPFEPPDSATPFGEPKYGSIVNPSPNSPFDQSNSSTPTLVNHANGNADPFNNTPTANRQSQSQLGKIPPPRPLDLPPPLTPPPRVDTPGVNTPPGPVQAPSSRTRNGEDGEGEGKERRWWTDWLCGCSEGPDRGGDHQAGRTNPFE